ncbi:hypothetical protein [Arthrobacter methylotrophus]|uniref:Uncharacterized protein n=1 Tax=Arthrobacter methylotrophus TaxID=121291 RepID=A0ABV5UN71_9MICC
MTVKTPIPESAHMTGMETFYGHVNTLEMFFSYGPDRELKFAPFNNAYGAVHPDAGPGTGINDVELVLNDGEYFQVSGFYRASDGGNFLNYRDAYRKAIGGGEQGSLADIVIVAPADPRIVTALAADGTEVVTGHNTQWRTISLPRRVRFLNRPATDPNISE